MPCDASAIVIFDDACLLCNRAVRFIVRNDPQGTFRFAALQDEERSEETMILVESDVRYVRSDAVLRILRRLRMPWPLFSVFFIIPRSLRDVVYRWVANNRYQWFGRAAACPLPDATYRARFL
jgi:predicted DCC family thiol-disulfide oxidoreductase YuxK